MPLVASDGLLSIPWGTSFSRTVLSRSVAGSFPQPSGSGAHSTRPRQTRRNTRAQSSPRPYRQFRRLPKGCSWPRQQPAWRLPVGRHLPLQHCPLPPPLLRLLSTPRIIGLLPYPRHPPLPPLSRGCRRPLHAHHLRINAADATARFQVPAPRRAHHLHVSAASKIARFQVRRASRLALHHRSPGKRRPRPQGLAPCLPCRPASRRLPRQG